MEIWRDIEGYEGIYQISNLGRIKSLPKLCGCSSRQEKILKSLKHRDGYLQVVLCKNKKRKNFKVHRLVAQAFILNPNNKPYINHIDCNRQNNCVDNLEWCTQKENMQYASQLGRMDGTKGKTNNDKKIPLIAINLVTGEETYFDSQHEAARQLNLHSQSINGVLKGKCKRAGNYTFKYIEENKQENTLF